LADAKVEAVIAEWRCAQGNSLLSIPLMAGRTRHRVERVASGVSRLAGRA
jgi:hypothetical protein